MVNIISWYFVLALLGGASFPLSFWLFPALADRGYTFSRALGLLMWGYIFWLFASLGIVYNNLSGLLFGALVFACISWTPLLTNRKLRKQFGIWLKQKIRLILTTEISFFLAFSIWAFVRASNPEITTSGGEKTMELAFINSILRSESFPPQDPWLSGYAISYYYFGYIMTAMLAKVTLTLGPVAHNLMTASIFAMSFTGSYGIIYNLIHVHSSLQKKVGQKGQFAIPLLGPLFLLFVSNLAGFLEVLHSRGVFWNWNDDGIAHSAFWSNLGIRNLDIPPTLPLQWMPTRYLWWWQTSRVIQDYDLNGTWHEIIDEFPAFSYLLGDLHPHVIAMPFVLLAISSAMNLLFGGWKGVTNLRCIQIKISPIGFMFGSFVVGGLAFLNTWDILLGFSLFVGAYVLTQAIGLGWNIDRIKDVITFGIPCGVLAILFFAPFYIGFSSQAGGILPNLENPTWTGQLWVMFGPLLIPIFAYLIHRWIFEKMSGGWKTSIFLTILLVFGLWIVSWILGLFIYLKRPELATLQLATSDGSVLTLSQYFNAGLDRRIQHIGGLLSLVSVLLPTLALLVSFERKHKMDRVHSHANTKSTGLFVLFLFLIGTVLILIPEFVYLRDLFGNRMNTVFKFYYQAWIVWSIAAAYGTSITLFARPALERFIFRGVLTVVLAASLIFPVLGNLNKTNYFRFPEFFSELERERSIGDVNPISVAASVWTLDGSVAFRNHNPDDASAADWLATAPYGVLVEAVGGQYTTYARFSVYSGQPAVLGWIGHEDQWRGTFDEQRLREIDIRNLYETRDWESCLSIIQKYNIRYVMIGELERQTYRVSESKFQQYLSLVYHSGTVFIYETPYGE